MHLNLGALYVEIGVLPDRYKWVTGTHIEIHYLKDGMIVSRYGYVWGMS